MAKNRTDGSGAPDKARRRGLGALIALAGFSATALLGAWLLGAAAPPPPGPPPAFRLRTLDGGVFEPSRNTGHAFAMFFGFTNCPIVCPTSLGEMTGWIEGLGEAGKEFRFYFVTLDSERDTPAKLKDYLENFSPQIIGLTGDDAEIAAAAKVMSVYYRRVPTSGGYTLDHTALVFLFDAHGRRRGVLNYDADKALALARLRALIDEGL